MSVSFTKKSLVEILILLAGALAVGAGKRQDSAALLGLGVVLIGLGVIWGGLSAIRHRRVVFLHRDSRIVTGRFSGGAAVIWGILLLLVGLALGAAGIGLALGYGDALRALVMQPGGWLIAGGVALFFAASAAVWQQAVTGTKGWLPRLLALPGQLLLLVGAFAGLALLGIGVWGLGDPQGLLELGTTARASLLNWIGTL